MNFMLPPFQRFNHLQMNHYGRDFICGDIHGEKLLLTGLLDHVSFNPACDRVIATGDLIDRGPASIDCIKLLEQPWFFSVVGNHEQLLLDYRDSDEASQNRWFANGGQWWQQVSQAEKTALRALILEKQCLAIELAVADYQVGIIHADFPSGRAWHSLSQSSFYADVSQLSYCLWARERLRFKANYQVSGIDFLFTGHNPVPELRQSHNVFMLDTGAGYEPSLRLSEPRLTMVTIVKDQLQVYSNGHYSGIVKHPDIQLKQGLNK